MATSTETLSATVTGGCNMGSDVIEFQDVHEFHANNDPPTPPVAGVTEVREIRIMGQHRRWPAS